MVWFSVLHLHYSVWKLLQFSCSLVSDSLWPHELQHARPPCPSPTPGVHSNSCLSSRWCHPAISSSVVPFSSCPQSLPASDSFPMSQLFAWCGQSTGALSRDVYTQNRLHTMVTDFMGGENERIGRLGTSPILLAWANTMLEWPFYEMGKLQEK